MGKGECAALSGGIHYKIVLLGGVYHINMRHVNKSPKIVML